MMEQTERRLTLRDAIAATKRRLSLLIVVSLAILFAGVLLVLFLPSIYKSQAIILIEKQEIPTDLVRSTVTSFADQRIQTISQRVMTSSNLIRIMDEFALYEDERKREATETIIQNMRENIALEMISADVVDPKSGRPTEATIAFSLSFEDKNPQKTQRVLNELVSLFLNENIKSRTDSAAETTTFLDEEATILRERIIELEKQIAKFQDEYSDSRPELEALTRNLMDRSELQLSEVDRRIHETMQQRIYLEAELAQIKPVIPDRSLSGASAIEQLRAVEAQLSAAEATYDEKHPDVGRLRKQAEALKATVEPNEARELYEMELEANKLALAELKERYGDTHPDVIREKSRKENLESKLRALPPPSVAIPNNPSYVALAARLEASRAQLASLEVKRLELTKKVDKFTQSLILVPDADAKFKALNRDYETTLAKYREITSKQMEARLSQNLESERKGEKFTLIEPPLLPERPAKPNRPAILLISFVFSALGGMGAAALAEALDDKIRGRRDVLDILSAPPLAMIPEIDDEVKSGRFKNMSLALGIFTVAILALLLLAHFFVGPLDVLWYSLIRRIGG